jgi:hypothetical protein
VDSHDDLVTAPGLAPAVRRSRPRRFRDIPRLSSRVPAYPGASSISSSLLQRVPDRLLHGQGPALSHASPADPSSASRGRQKAGLGTPPPRGRRQVQTFPRALRVGR